MARGRPEPLPPTREEVLRWLAATPDARRQDVLDAFAVHGRDKLELKRTLRALEAEGLVDLRRRGTRPAAAPSSQKLPPVAVVDVTAIDEEGDLVLRAPEMPETRILLPVETLGRAAPGVGDRLLARLRRLQGGTYEARLLKLLPKVPREVVGRLERATDGFRLRPADRRARGEYVVAAADGGEAEIGDLVRAEILPGRRLALPRARVVERIGSPDDPRALTLLVAVQAELPIAFAPEALALAEKARPVGLEGRVDLRDVPLVTIDGEDARDFDDAVWAAPDDDPANAGGHRLLVAIADVAWYVRPGDALDRAAHERGNSVYFPDRVVPMLPEALSNDLCSLRAGEDRACIAADLRIDRHGRIKRHGFVRGLMRSRARLTYDQVQRAADGAADEATAPLLDPVIRPLYAAYAVLAAARHRRGTIELDLPELRIFLDEAGFPEAIKKRQRLASHMLIEELMIAANVAAAEALEAARAPCLYRVHDRPDAERLLALAQFLERLGIPWSHAAAHRPGDFTALLERLKDHELRDMIAGLVLRAQAQAVYSPKNIGHFGLHLGRYAHFTSPIRRYSDLFVHRALIRALGLGEGGLPDLEKGRLDELGQHLSRCERRAMECERRALDRYVTLFMASRVGALFAGRVTAVQRFGLFVTLDETGAEGLIHVSTLGDDAYLLDERHHALVGQRFGESFGLGDRVRVELTDADPLTGQLAFRLEAHERARGAELARTAWRKGRGTATRRGPGGTRRGRA